MVREYLRGDPVQTIGERHGVSHQRVRYLMLAFGACRVPDVSGHVMGPPSAN
jgi:hypothetical protein